MRLVQRGLPRFPVLAADTAVVLDGHVFGKPESPAHAREMLAALSGRTHQVLTSVALALNNETAMRLSASTVQFRDLTDSEIFHYAESGEPLDKAGGYAIQGKAAAFISEISGSYSGVMGLPLFETAELLQASGIKILI